MSDPLDRVRKLLALAESPNVHEAALAAARAQALIEKHRLQAALAAAEEPPSIEDGIEAPLDTGRRLRKWKRVLASVLAEANGCRVYTAKLGREHRIVLVGTPEDQAAVRLLWDWLVKRIEWLSATHSDGRSKAWHEAFRVGAVDTIARRLREARTSSRQELTAAALVTVDTALARRTEAVERFVEENLNLKRGRPIRVDARAYDRGREAGETLDLPGE